MLNLVENKELKNCLETLFSNVFFSENIIDNFWLNIFTKTPNYELLTKNIFNNCVNKKGTPIFLVSVVEEKEAELDIKKEISGGLGCLGNVIYCVQAYPHKNNTYGLHNFGTVVMKHRNILDMTPLLFSISTDSERIGRMNYLRVGKLIDYIRKNSDILDNDELKDKYSDFRARIIQISQIFIDETLNKYKLMKSVGDYENAKSILNEISSLGKEFNFLSYIYFEAVSLALMLCSVDKDTLHLKEKGEFNHLPYIEIVHRYKSNRIDKKFESYGFVPNVEELEKILEDLKKEEIIDLNLKEIVITIANNIFFYIGTSMNNKDSIEGMIFHDFCHLDEFRKKCKPKLDKYSSCLKNKYMEARGFDLVINSVIEKGEIGICPSISSNKFNAYISKYSDDLKTIFPKNKIFLKLKMIEEYKI